jgi:four helix bundle protein
MAEERRTANQIRNLINRGKTMSSIEKEKDLKVRTKQFALRVISMYSALPKSDVARVLGRQVLRSGTSVGAQYREGCRARSTAEFVSKIESAIQELDETKYWFELIVGSKLVKQSRMESIEAEADELLAILTASVKTAKRRK